MVPNKRQVAASRCFMDVRFALDARGGGSLQFLQKRMKLGRGSVQWRETAPWDREQVQEQAHEQAQEQEQELEQQAKSCMQR